MTQRGVPISPKKLNAWNLANFGTFYFKNQNSFMVAKIAGFRMEIWRNHIFLSESTLDLEISVKLLKKKHDFTDHI